MRLLVCFFAFATICSGQQTVYTDAGIGPGRGRQSVGEAAEKALQLMKLALPGTTPFHLKARIYETVDQNSDRQDDRSEYKAEVEEYWFAPDKWRRTIVSPVFSQTTVVNSDRSFGAEHWQVLSVVALQPGDCNLRSTSHC